MKISTRVQTLFSFLSLSLSLSSSLSREVLRLTDRAFWQIYRFSPDEENLLHFPSGRILATCFHVSVATVGGVSVCNLTGKHGERYSVYGRASGEWKFPMHCGSISRRVILTRGSGQRGKLWRGKLPGFVPLFLSQLNTSPVLFTPRIANEMHGGSNKWNGKMV